MIIGTITEVTDKDLYTIKVDIPGVNKDLVAFPKRSEIDEPRVGDSVILTEVDPVWHSYYIYEKIKENDFIGIRARGKVVQFKDDEVTVGIFDPSDDKWYDDNSGKDPTPAPTSWIKIDKDGNIDINAEGKVNINIGGDCNITISGNAKIESSGNCDIKASGNCTVNSPNTKLTGGNVTVSGTAAPTGKGSWCGIPNCLMTGAPHVGDISSGC